MAAGDERPYANVTAVTASGDPGAYIFAVSVESADIDCGQYADWWELLSEDGSLIYRRILAHSHTDENGQRTKARPATPSPGVGARWRLPPLRWCWSAPT